MKTDFPTARYDRVAVAIHWLAAAVILLMLASGLTMEYIELEKKLKYDLYQWHKSLGVLFLWLIGLRLLWRITHRPPALPGYMHSWEKRAAKLGHFALYVAMILMPLSGWAMVSSSSYGLPTIVFDGFEWPHIPGIGGNDDIHDFTEDLHSITAFTLIGLIAAHIGGALKHSVIDKQPIFYRMKWGRK